MATINAITLDEKELLSRAKTLYFDKSEELDIIYADEYGRFSYSKGFLLEQTKSSNGKVFEITRKLIKEAKVCRDLDKESDRKEYKEEKNAKVDLKNLDVNKLRGYISDNKLDIETKDVKGKDKTADVLLKEIEALQKPKK